MALPSGSRLGPFEIITPLGAGGMGEVYRAHDGRLGRDVALKCLSARLTQDAAAVDRFTREARAASALNHPHIVTIHDIGEHQSQHFIVMELVVGLTLRALIAERPAVDVVVHVGEQIAKALAAAHAAGIVHRDVKPENVMVIVTSKVVPAWHFLLAAGSACMRSSRNGPTTPRSRLLRLPPVWSRCCYRTQGVLGRSGAGRQGCRQQLPGRTSPGPVGRVNGANDARLAALKSRAMVIKYTHEGYTDYC